MGTGGPIPGTKERPGSDADHSPHLMPWSRMSRSYTSSHPSTFIACSGTVLALAFIYPVEKNLFTVLIPTDVVAAFTVMLLTYNQ
jgi:hypothetical protein